MNALQIKALTPEDENVFLAMTQSSQEFHHPWVKAPLTHEEFQRFYQRYQADNQKSYLLFHQQQLVGVFNISEMVRGAFQSAYLGFYAAVAFSGKGLMTQGLSLLLKEAFTTLKLHRLEANIQPGNAASLALVKKNGFRKEGYSLRYLYINDQWCDHERFAITIEEWQQGNSI